MSKVSLAVMILCVLAVAVSAQRNESCGDKGGTLLSEDKPRVYITFEREGGAKPATTRLASTGASKEEPDEQADESTQAVWLRLNNNTRWAINFPTESLYIGPKTIPMRLCNGRGALGLSTGMEVNARYEVEAISGYESVRTSNGGITINSPRDVPKLPMINRSDVFSTSWLPAGGSVIFTVPREHLGKRLAIYINFNYESQFDERGLRSNEQAHRVYFRASDLPENSMSKIN